MTKIIAITGPDGAGKSSVCSLLATLFLPNTKVVNIWDSLDQSPFYPCKSCIHTYLKENDPLSRSLLILHGISQSLNRALSQKPDTLILDGYWYKYAVTEEALSGYTKQFELAANLLPKAHLTFFLDAKPITTINRKDYLSSFELGLTEKKEPQAQFLSFQGLVYEAWQHMRTRNPHWHEIDTQNISAPQVADLIYQISRRDFIHAH
jgi:thymidylate kinase